MTKLYLLLIVVSAVSTFGFVDAGKGLVYLAPILLLLIASIWPVRWTAPWQEPPRGLDRFFLIWAAYLFLSMAWSAWPQATFWLAIPVASIPLVCMAGSRLFQLEQAWSFVRRLMNLVALAYAAWIVIEFFTKGGRSDGPLLDPNAAAALLNLFMLPTLWRACAPATPRRDRLLQIALLALLSAALFSTASRGAMVALAGAIGLSGVILLSLRLPFSRTALALSCVAFMAGSIAVHLGPHAVAERAIVGATNDASTQARLLIWESTWRIVQSHPLLGAGFGSFAAVYPQHRSPAENDTVGAFAHNDYLQFLAEGGIPLLMMLLWFGFLLTKWVYGLIATSGQTRRQREFFEALGLFAGLASAFAHASVNFVVYVAPIALWIGIYSGRIGALAIRARDTGTSGTATGFRRHMRPMVAGLGIAAGVLLAGDIVSYYWLSRDRLAAEEYEVSSARFDGAVALTRLNPFNTTAYDYLVRAQTKLAIANRTEFAGWFMAKAALRDIEAIERIRHASCPHQVMKSVLLAAVPQLRGDGPPLPSPEEVLVQALRRDPTCLDASLMLASLYRSQGNPERALEVLENGNRWLHLGTLNMDLRIKMLEATASSYLELDRPDQAVVIARLVLNNDPERPVARQLLEEALARLEGTDSM